MSQSPAIANRFRGYYPVVIDVETGGFNAQSDALLEIGLVTVRMDSQGILHPHERLHYNVDPFPGANLEKEALEFTGIDPSNPLRGAVTEATAMEGVFNLVRRSLKDNGCKRAILVAHNAVFDQSFLQAATARCELKRDPFHPFSSFDTAALAGLVYGQTVLAKACEMAGIPFSQTRAHSALYDATRTAELFCSLVNRFRSLGGWPPPAPRDIPPTLFDKNSEL